MRRKIAGAVLAAGMLTGTFVGATATSASAATQSKAYSNQSDCDFARGVYSADRYYVTICYKYSDRYGTSYRFYYW